MRRIASRGGYRLDANTNRFERETVTAWNLGARMARRVRNDAGIKDGPVDDMKLVQLLGVESGALDEGATDSRIAFLLDQDDSQRSS